MSARQMRRASDQRMRRQRKQLASKTGIGAGAALGASVLLAPAAEAATFTVTNLNDIGAGSLREAAVNANSNNESDAIIFQSGLSGTIDLGDDIDFYDQGVDLQGPGASQLTIDGGGDDNIFDLYDVDAPGTQVRISGLTLTDGATGNLGGSGAVYQGEAGGVFAPDVVLDGVVISDSYTTGPGGGVYNAAGNLTITNSTITGNAATGDGGGIAASAGDLVIRDSKLDRNVAGSAGGGLYAGGADTAVERSSFTANGAEGGDGGGIYFGHDGAPDVGITVASSTFTQNRAEDRGGGGLTIFGGTKPAVIENSTISGNSTGTGAGDRGGGVYLYTEQDQPVTIRNSTIVGNTAGGTGGGVYRYGYDNAGGGVDEVTISSSIVSGNTAPDGNLGDQVSAGDPGPVAGSFILGHSLIGNAGATTTESPAGSNLLGVDPLLGPLADNGGPTQTHAPAIGSPVIDKGIANGLANDQRGLARTFDASNIANAAASDGTDIGAVELAAEGSCKGKAATVLYVAGQPITGGDANDVIVGTEQKDKVKAAGGKDTVCAGKGKDKVSGQGGKDKLFGEAGKDTLKGGGGKDKLSGQGGKDTLKGGGGKDTLKGGAGKDKLRGGPGKDKLNGGPGKDSERQ